MCSIIGAGIAGSALVSPACIEASPSPDMSGTVTSKHGAQGYGLTLQQASNAIKGLGLFHLKDQCQSTRHVVLSTDGTEIVEWEEELHLNTQKAPKRTNIHIPRQSLRSAPLEQLAGSDNVKWGHRLLSFERNADGKARGLLHGGGQDARDTDRSSLVGPMASGVQLADCSSIKIPTRCATWGIW
jgi:hypothetical protein